MDQDKKMKYCNYCDNLIEYNGRTIGLKGVYKRLYEPWQFFEGKKNSLIWIVGINQAFHERKYEVDKGKMETKDSLEDVFSKWKSVGNKYYESFKLLSPYLYEWLGEEYGVASTEVIRCGSLSNKPESHLDCTLEDLYGNLDVNTEQDRKLVKRQWGTVTERIRNNCLPHFKTLIDNPDYNMPLLIICNGKPSCKTLAEILLPADKREELVQVNGVKNFFEIPTYSTNYMRQGITHKVTVIQSDFMSRLPSNLTRKHVGITVNNVMEQLDLIKVRDALLNSGVF